MTSFGEIPLEMVGIILSYSLVSPKKIAATLLRTPKDVRQPIIDYLSEREAEQLAKEELSTLEEIRDKELTVHSEICRSVELVGGTPPPLPEVTPKTKEEFVQELRVRPLEEVLSSLKNKQLLLNDKLVRAIERDSLDDAKEAVESGADVDDPTGDWILRTPLIMSIFYSRGSISRYLLEQGASVNKTDKQGRTPLMYAGMIMNGDVELVEELLRRGANINKVSRTGSSALLLACQNSSTKIATLLIDRGADVNYIGANKKTPLIECCLHGDWGNTLLLIDKGADLNHQNDMRKTALSYAILWGDVSRVDYFLKKGAVPLLQDLVDVMANDQMPIFFTLVKYFTKVRENPSLLITAVKTGNTLYIDSLLQKGADINYQNKGEISLGVVVSASGHVCKYKGGDKYLIAEYLLERGADPDLSDHTESTPLERAIQQGDLRMVKLMLTKGFSKICKKKAGETAKEWYLKNKSSCLNREAEDYLSIADYFEGLIQKS